ncbi:MAG: single-stranded DNA-binding protein [Kiritimatiellaeota bacterium]|nr:single-stranded DNA-binding protein [Kiritimatiellota bacterium]
MASYNRVILLGNLCRDPELRKTPGGASVAELRLAVNEVYKNRTTGEKMEKTCYVDVVVWNQQAELCQQYLHKGSPLLVEGRLQYDEWKTPQGESRSKLRVTAERIQFVGAKPQQADGAPKPPMSPTPPPVATGMPEPDPMTMDPGNDDPPF